MTVKGGTTQACAACKYRRCKCSSQCLLAPYFPATEPNRFQSARRLYGVANMINLLKQLDSTEDRDEAMRSVIYESEMRQRFPVHGCCGVIQELQYQLVQSVRELQRVEAELAAFKEAQLQEQIVDHDHGYYGPSELDLEANFANSTQVFHINGTSFEDMRRSEDHVPEHKLKNVTSVLNL